MDEQKKQRGGWFRRGRRDMNTTSTAPSTPQPGNSGKFAQAISSWARSVQERRDTANRTRDLANKLSGELAAILQTCAEQDRALGQRSVRSQLNLSMALGRLTGIVRQLEATRAVCAYLLETTQPQLPAVSMAMLTDGSNASMVGANGTTAILAAPASPSRPLLASGNPSGPLAAPVVRELGRGGYRRMARDLQRVFRATSRATEEILRPISMQGFHVPEVNALANALAAIEPLMTWLNQQCEALTTTYCAPPNGQQPYGPNGQ